MLHPYRYTKSIRLWHWLSAINILLIMISVLVGKFYVNDYANHLLITGQLQKKGISIPGEVSFDIAHAIGARIWNTHIALGYSLAVLVCFRCIIEFFQVKSQKLWSRVRLSFQWIKFRRSRSKGIKSLFQQAVYSGIYISLLSSVTTGIWLANTKTQDFELKHKVLDYHGPFFFILLFLILMHLAGVLWKERKEHGNLVSSMIHGGVKEVPKEKTELELLEDSFPNPF